MAKKQQKYQFIVSIFSTNNFKVEQIYYQLKKYISKKYSNRVMLNKLYKMTDIEKERKEKAENRKKKKISDIKFINEG